MEKYKIPIFSVTVHPYVYIEAELEQECNVWFGDSEAVHSMSSSYIF